MLSFSAYPHKHVYRICRHVCVDRLIDSRILIFFEDCLKDLENVQESKKDIMTDTEAKYIAQTIKGSSTGFKSSLRLFMAAQAEYDRA